MAPKEEEEGGGGEEEERTEAPWWSVNKGKSMRGNKSLKEMGAVMDCVVQGFEHSMDILSCEVDTELDADSAVTPTSVKQKQEDLLNQDYAKLHEEFLLSLLQEQAKLQNDPEPVEIPISSSTSSLSQPPPIQQPSSPLFSTETLQSSSSTEGAVSISSSPTKRKRALKLPRRPPKKVSPNRVSSSKSKRQVAPLVNQDSVVKPVTPNQQPPSALPHPGSYLHPMCRLQKDKGRGEEPGSDVCAYGVEKCLDKLRQKMELLTHIALAEGSSRQKMGSAIMKRRKAKLTAETQTYTETRSLIDLRKGFLSMQYGVLLRWDTVNTGKIALVVLRKMCHESFYQMKLTSKRKLIRPADSDSSAYIVQNQNGGNDVILLRHHCTEVSLLEPPYRVEQPPSFTPSVLTVSVLRLVGMSDRSKCWTVYVHFQGTYRKTRVVYDPMSRTHTPLSETLFDWEVPVESVDLDLEISAFEHRRRRTRKRSLVARESVPLNLLESRPTSRISHKRVITVPIENGYAVLSVLHQSDYAFWLSQELDARRNEHQHQGKQKFRRVAVVEAPPEPKVGDLWELCCVW